MTNNLFGAQKKCCSQKVPVLRVVTRQGSSFYFPRLLFLPFPDRSYGSLRRWCQEEFSWKEALGLHCSNVTLTLHREEISSPGSAVSTEGSEQTDFFIQLILKPEERDENKKERCELLLLYTRGFFIKILTQTRISGLFRKTLTINVIPKAEFLLDFSTIS